MALPARQIEAEISMEARIARLETHTEHILSDVAGLCRGMEILREKLESKTDALNKKIDEKADELNQKINQLSEKIDSKANELNQKFDGKFGELQKALDSMRVGRVWDRVWMLLAMGALLGVMARGFKWI